LKLLDSAAEYLTLHENEENCPVCEQPVDRAMLLTRLPPHARQSPPLPKVQRVLHPGARSPGV
jgi:hypothetical protein